MAGDSWHGLRAGDQIGNLEYLVDEAVLAQYRQLVGSEGCFPNLMAEDSRAMLERHAAGAPLTTVWQRLDFLRPPVVGRRIQVGGWAREIRGKCGRTWIKTAAFAVDEIGTEILRSEAAFAAGREQSQPVTMDKESPEIAVSGHLAHGQAGDGGLLGRLRLPDSDRLREYRALANKMARCEMGNDGNGLSSVTAGWLECLLGAEFGEDFRWGGRLSIAFHREVWPGAELICDGVVMGHDTDPGGVETRRVAMSVRDAADCRVATAEAVVQSPSPRLI